MEGWLSGPKQRFAKPWGSKSPPWVRIPHPPLHFSEQNRKILAEISKLYNEKLGDSLISVYIRGNVSVGKAKSGISDIDSIAVTKKEAPREEY